jgi:hypothetical protein
MATPRPDRRGVSLGRARQCPSRYDPPIALAFAMTALGTLMPALKAIRVDPLEVMRGE